MLKRLTIKPKLGPSVKKVGSISSNGTSGKSTTVKIEKEDVSKDNERKVLENSDALSTEIRATVITCPSALENVASNGQPKPQGGNMEVNVNSKVKQERFEYFERGSFNLSETGESTTNITRNKNADELATEATIDVKQIDTLNILSKANLINDEAMPVGDSSKTVLKTLEVKPISISQSNSKNVCKPSLAKYGPKKMLNQLSLKPKLPKYATEKLKEIRKKEEKHKKAESKQDVNEALAELAAQIRSEAEILPETGVRQLPRTVAEEKKSSDLPPAASTLQSVRKDEFAFHKLKESRVVNRGIDSHSTCSDSIDGSDIDARSVAEMQKPAQKKMIKLKRSKAAEFEYFYNIRDKFVEKLAKEGEEQIDPSELSISELCFYSKEFFSKLKPKIDKRNEKTMKEKELETNQTHEETAKTVTIECKNDATTEPSPPVEKGPIVTFDEEGNFQIDMQSLEIETEEAAAERRALESQTAVDSRSTSFSRFGKPKARKRRICFSRKETAKFYTALTLVGTNFDKMTQFFPHYTRNDLLYKFKSEDKKNPELITNLLKKVKFDIEVYSQLLDSSEEEDEDVDESKENRTRKKGQKVKDETEEKKGSQKQKSTKDKNKAPKKRKATEHVKKSVKKPRTRHPSVNTTVSSSTLFDYSVDVDMGLDEIIDEIVKNDNTCQDRIDISDLQDFNEDTLDQHSNYDENAESFSETHMDLSRSLSVKSISGLDVTKDCNVSSDQHSIPIADTQNDNTLPSALPETDLFNHPLQKHGNDEENAESFSGTPLNLSGRSSAEFSGGFDISKDYNISYTELSVPITNSSRPTNNVPVSPRPEEDRSAESMPPLLKLVVSNDLVVTEKEKELLGNIFEDNDVKFTISKFPEIPETNAYVDNSKLLTGDEVERNGFEVPISLNNVETLPKLADKLSSQESVIENTFSDSPNKSPYYVPLNEIIHQDLSLENNLNDTLDRSSRLKQISLTTDRPKPQPIKKTTGRSLLRSLSMKPTMKKKFNSNITSSSSNVKSGCDSSLSPFKIDNKDIALCRLNSNSEESGEDSQHCSFSEKQKVTCPSVVHKLSTKDPCLNKVNKSPERSSNAVNTEIRSCASLTVLQSTGVMQNTQQFREVLAIPPPLSDSCQRPSEFTRSATKTKKLASFRNLIANETPFAKNNSVFNSQQCDSLSLSESVLNSLKLGSLNKAQYSLNDLKKNQCSVNSQTSDHTTKRDRDSVPSGTSVKLECPAESSLNNLCNLDLTKVKSENHRSKSNSDVFVQSCIDSNAFNELCRQVEARQADQKTSLGSGASSTTRDESTTSQFQSEKILRLENIPPGSLVIVPDAHSDLGSIKVFRKC
ncbi:uncharacterized protein LOC136033246 [Artemia franciscana]|uniref:Transcription factor TFIIIB component B'' Myb domain-containing protein n=1 Tax=Artemia franciscana TaxID=6661 RepID=A0AA88IAK5_ARTSF|nr:hypothetical protein QYM36_001417 [Artemia franciscana]KAK2724956.1 hypothetical protein QYM36_001417 [Artemia franciscana]